jgi:hypothetical protein
MLFKSSELRVTSLKSNYITQLSCQLWPCTDHVLKPTQQPHLDLRVKGPLSSLTCHRPATVSQGVEVVCDFNRFSLIAKKLVLILLLLSSTLSVSSIHPFL